MAKLVSPRDALAAAIELLRSPQHGLPLDVDATGTTVAGAAFLAWLIARQLAGSLEEARQMARALVQREFLSPVQPVRVPFAEGKEEARYRVKDVAVSTKRRLLRNLSQQESPTAGTPTPIPAPNVPAAKAASPRKGGRDVEQAPSSAPGVPSPISVQTAGAWLAPQSNSLPRAPLMHMGTTASDDVPTHRKRRTSMSLPSLPPLPAPASLVVRVSHADFEPTESFVSGTPSLTLGKLATSFAEAAAVPLSSLRLTDAEGSALAVDTPLAAVPDRHIVVHFVHARDAALSDPDAPDAPCEPPHTPALPPPVVLSLPREVLAAVASELALPPPPQLLPLSGRPEHTAPILDDRKRKALLTKLEKENKGRKGQPPLAQLGGEHERLTELARMPDVVAAVATVCDHADVDGQVRLWRRLLGPHMEKVLARVLEDEVQGTTAQSTLFRSNNFTVGLLAAHTRAVCVPFLQTVLAPLLSEVIASGRVFELNEAKSTPVQVQADTRDFMALLDRFIGVFENNVEHVPAELRKISHVLATTVAAKFPAASSIAVGGLVFLRIVCPSIVSPDGFGLLPAPVDPQARRTLVLVSKALQNLANRTPFKEAHMRTLDAWLEQAAPRMAGFLTHLAAPLTASATQGSGEMLEPLTRPEYAQVAAFLMRSSEKLRTTLGAVEVYESLSSAASRIAELEAVLVAKKK